MLRMMNTGRILSSLGIHRSTTITRRRQQHSIAVALSGGVDSSVAAHLLCQTWGKEKVLGIHMSNWNYHNEDRDESLLAQGETTTNSPSGCWEQEWKDAQAVAHHLDIDCTHTSFEQEYWNEVFSPYLSQLSSPSSTNQDPRSRSTTRTRTPNPDVQCNRIIKFGVLKDYIQQRYGLDRLATGHYARLWDPTDTSTPTSSTHRMSEFVQEAVDINPSLYELMDRETPSLFCARDLSKDQSYFLSCVPGTALRNVSFPLGDLYKQTTVTATNESQEQKQATSSVREIAVRANLPTAHKRDSMGICFVGKRNHARFVSEYLEEPTTSQSSNSDSSTSMIGRCIHVEDPNCVVSTFDPKTQPSLLYSTIGQGAKLGGAAQKWFVVDRLDPFTVVVCPGTHHASLYSDSLFVTKIHWIAGKPPPSRLFPLRAQCRVRHLQPLVDCEIRQLPSGYEIRLNTPLRAITPGQVCGIYVDSILCLGGGEIVGRGPSYLAQGLELPTHLHPSGHNDTLVDRCG